MTAQAERIRALNDQLRRDLTTGVSVITPGAHLNVFLKSTGPDHLVARSLTLDEGSLPFSILHLY